jgi:1-acyl-sn-glycerol-3-phosphate acyltransferase
MLRYLCLNAFIAIHSIIFCLWALFLSIFDKNGRKIHFYSAAPWSRVILKVCGIRVWVHGQEDVDPGVPRIYMTNHQSYFDIFALLAFLPVDFKFIVKQELMKIPFLGPAMRKAGYIGIEREDPRKAVKSIKKAAQRIAGGASVVIFPEGTRSTDGRLQPFKRGGFNLALKSKCDIVPVTIKDSYRIVPKGSLKINKGSFHIYFGKPISSGEYNKQNVTQLMDRVRGAMLSQLGQKGNPGTHDGDFIPKGQEREGRGPA